MTTRIHPIMIRIRLTLPVLAALMLLSGCASMGAPTEGGMGENKGLYAGKSELLFGTALPVTTAEEAIARAQGALAKGDLDRALFEYIRALDVDPGNAEALNRIGAIHVRKGSDELAEKAYRMALEGNPNLEEAQVGLGSLLMRDRNYAEARQHLEAAVRLNARSAAALNALGVLDDLQRRYQAAQARYQQALAISPDKRVYNNLGYSRYLSADWKGAATAFQKALLQDPDYERAWRNLALVRARQGRYEDAIDAISRVESLPKAYNDIGYLAMLDGDLESAEYLLTDAQRLSPEYYPLAETNLRRLALLESTDGMQ